MTTDDRSRSETVHYRGSWEEFSWAPAVAVLSAAAASALTAIALFAVLVLWCGSYGILLFFCTPLLMGLVAAVVVNHREHYRFASTALALLASHLIVAVVMVAFALEGLICLAMAAPLSIPVGLLGAGFGLEIARQMRGEPRSAAVLLLLLPLLLGGAALEPDWPLREVATEIVIDAPPEQVWPHVIGFGELPPPSALVFRLGIAHPLRAHLDGRGVGAVRYCEFSTGPFVEPITLWDPPRTLAFDVVAQPEPMHEWSPYRKVHAPHLLDGLQSRRGRFDLIERADGSTLVRGTTWYELQMGPQAYWGLWSDAIIHEIHLRVLRQIRTESEAGLPRAPESRL